jgi:hypothetical protein
VAAVGGGELGGIECAPEGGRDASQLAHRAVAGPLQQCGLGLGGGDPGDDPGLPVGDLAAREGGPGGGQFL